MDVTPLRDKPVMHPHATAEENDNKMGTVVFKKAGKK